MHLTLHFYLLITIKDACHSPPLIQLRSLFPWIRKPASLEPSAANFAQALLAKLLEPYAVIVTYTRAHSAISHTRTTRAINISNAHAKSSTCTCIKATHPTHLKFTKAINLLLKFLIYSPCTNQDVCKLLWKI